MRQFRRLILSLLILLTLSVSLAAADLNGTLSVDEGLAGNTSTSVNITEPPSEPLPSTSETLPSDMESGVDDILNENVSLPVTPLVEDDIPRGFGVFFLRMKRIFVRNAEARARLELRLALAALKRAERAAERGRPAEVREALRVYGRHIKNAKRILTALPQPPEAVLEKLSLYTTYEERVRERLASINMSDVRDEKKGLNDIENESFDDILSSLHVDEERRVELRKKIFEKHGVSPRVLLANEKRFLQHVEARYLLAVQLNISSNLSEARTHLRLARDAIRAAEDILRRGSGDTATSFNQSAFEEHLRSAHTHAVKALRLLKPVVKVGKPFIPKPVVIRAGDKLIIQRNDTLRILPLPKHATERIIREMRDREDARVFTPEDLRDALRREDHAFKRLSKKTLSKDRVKDNLQKTSRIGDEATSLPDTQTESAESMNDQSGTGQDEMGVSLNVSGSGGFS